jgi:superfamily II DNA or RNA helicase
LTKPEYSLRPYQREALDRWADNNNRGNVIIGTGGGKTFLALEVIHKLQLRTLIIVPTIDLIRQWEERIIGSLNLPPHCLGKYGGGHRSICDVTITTYSSAYLHTMKFRNQFGLVIFDEVHHLFAEKYKNIAEGLIAPFRLGLSATLEDVKTNPDVKRLVGPIVYTISPQQLRETKYIADYVIKRIYVELTTAEAKSYKRLRDLYFRACRKYNITMHSGRDFQQLVLRSGYDPLVRKAILAHQESRQIAFQSEGKFDAIEKLLKKHRNDKIILFSEYTNTVRELQQRFLLPALTSKTPKPEREELLSRFRKNELSKLASSRVLDEGIDVPDVNIGIIVSGSSTKRQTIQRLGRILRKKRKPAILYEIITRGTSEVTTMYRRDPETQNGENS